MKKALSLILALVMVLGLSVPALADGDTKDATVTATVPGMTYEMVVPSAADLTETSHSEVRLGGDTGTVTVTNVSHADASKKIVYTVTFGNEMFLKNGDKSMAVSYKVDDNTLTTDSEVTVFDGSDTVDSVVTATVADTVWAAAAEGTYTEILTFHFAVKEVDTSIKYMDWDDAQKKLVEKPVPNDAIEVTSGITTLNAGIYVVKGENVQINSTLTVNGTTAQPTTLILMDGAKLTVTGTSDNPGIKVASGKALVITVQSGGTGELTATGGSSDMSGGGTGIGGGWSSTGGSVTINGGTVTATGKSGGAGIGGGGGNGSGGTVTINGGTVTATGTDGAAGIGGGNNGGGGTVTINGGTVTATGSDLGVGIGGGGGNPGTVTFGAGVSFTVYAGDAAPGTKTPTAEYAHNHNAKYVKIEETPGSV